MRQLLATLVLVIVWAIPSSSAAAQVTQFCGDRYCGGAVADAPSSRGDGGVRGGVSLTGVVPPLAAKARQIVSACGSRVISAVRHIRVRGSGRLSLHASGRAVDIAGNPSCIYAHLKNWPGGVSTDYSRVRCGDASAPVMVNAITPSQSRAAVAV